MSDPAAAALALLTAAAAPFDVPPLPPPGEGYAALFSWLQAVNSELSIPDTEFRWVFGGFSIPIILLFELVGIRKDWKLYPFLVPFWLLFGSAALGVVGGVAATAAHLVLFPVGRTWFMLRDRRRARETGARGPTAAPAHGLAPPQAQATTTRRGRPTAQEILGGALEAIRRGVEERGGARPTAGGGPGKPPEATLGAVLRALGAALGAAAAQSSSARAPPRPPPLGPPSTTRPPEHPSPAHAHPSEATGARPAKPDVSAFRPDLSRFRRRPP